MSVTIVESKEVSADGAAITGKGTFYGASVFAGTAKIYDDAAAATGNLLMETSLPGLALPFGVRFQNGIYVDLTTGPVTVYFTRGA